MPDLARMKSGPMRTERQSDGRRRLLRDLDVEVEATTYTIPEDTITDFSSIPWFGRILVRWSRVDIAGVVHDYLYEEQTVTRAAADRVWRVVAMAGERHANAFQAWVGWMALRIGGWIAWNKRRARRARRDAPRP
jgi:hypothetical protein